MAERVFLGKPDKKSEGIELGEPDQPTLDLGEPDKPTSIVDRHGTGYRLIDEFHKKASTVWEGLPQLGRAAATTLPGVNILAGAKSALDTNAILNMFVSGVKEEPSDVLLRGPAAGLTKFSRKFYERFDALSGRMADLTGLEKGGAFKEAAEIIPQVEEPHTMAGRFVSDFTQAGMTVGEIMSLSRLTGSPSAAMATLGGVEAAAAGGGIQDIAVGATSSYLMGRIFQGTGYLPKILSLPTNALLFGGMTAQGLAAARGGVENLTPEDKEQILIDAMVGTLLAIPGKGPTIEEFSAAYRKKGWDNMLLQKSFSEFEDLAGSQDVRNQLKDILEKTRGTMSELEIREALKDHPQFKDVVRDRNYNLRQSPVGGELLRLQLLAQEAGKKNLPRYSDEQAIKTHVEELKKPKAKAAVKEETTQANPGPTPTAEAKPVTVTVYHGSGFKEIREGQFEALSFFTPDKKVAQAYAKDRGSVEGNTPTVHKVKLTFTNPQYIENGTVRNLNYEQMADLARKAGHDGIVFTEKGKPVEYMTLEKGVTPAESISTKGPETRPDLAEQALAEPPIKPAGRKKKPAEPAPETPGLAVLEPTAEQRALEKAAQEMPVTPEIVSGLFEKGLPKKPAEPEPTREEVTPEVRRVFFEPPQHASSKPAEKAAVDMTAAEREARSVQVHKDIAKIEKRLQTLEPDSPDFNQGMVQLDLLEAEARALSSVTAKKRVSEARKIAQSTGDAELDQMLAEEEAALANRDKKARKSGKVIEPTLQGELVQDLLEDVQLTLSTDRPTDIRKGMKPAARIISTGEKLVGKNIEEIAGRIQGMKGTDTAVEFGYMDKNGDFISLATMGEGLVERIKITDKVTLKSFLKFLSDQRGSIDMTGQRKEWPPYLLEQLKEMKDLYRIGMKAAQKEGKSIETWLREKGVSDEGVEYFKKVILAEVQSREIITKATGKQQGYIREMLEELGYDKARLDEIKQSLGMVEVSRRDMTYDQAMGLINRLNFEYEAKYKELPEEQMIKYRILTDAATSRSRGDAELLKSLRPDLAHKVIAGAMDLKDAVQELMDSPDIVFGRDKSGKGLQFYDAFDKADMRTRAMVQQIMGEKGFNIDKYEKELKPDSESSRRIGLALERNIDPASLPPKELEAMKAQEGFYKFAGEKFMEHKIPDEYRRQLIKSLADTIKFNKHEDPGKIEKSISDMRKAYSLTRGEVEALDFWRMKIMFYMPHIIDKGYLIGLTKARLESLEKSGSKDAALIQQVKDYLVSLESGRLVVFSRIPKSIKFDYFKERFGMPGYKIDAGTAFNIYLRGWLRKMFDEPALQQAFGLYKELPSDLRPYARDFVSHYMGWDKRSRFIDNVKSFEWMRTLGLNPRSAISNATQVINSLAESMGEAVFGEGYSGGFAKALTKSGREQFNDTGLPREIPQYMYSGEVGGAVRSTFEKLRVYSGFMFNAVEYGLRLHSFHTGREMALKKGLSDIKGPDGFSEADWFAISFVHKTNFRYGRMGMPKVMRGPAGVVTQFSSYLIKQMELIYKWSSGVKHLDTPEGRADFTKLLAFVALASGTKNLVKALGGDVSNALGAGVSWAEVIRAISDASKEDWEGVSYHMQVAFQEEGSGILPQQFPLLSGPALDTFTKLRELDFNPKTMRSLLSTIEVVMAGRLRDAVYALKYGDYKNNRFPIYKFDSPTAIVYAGKPKELKYYLTASQLFSRTFAVKPYSETQKQLTAFKHKLRDEREAKVLANFYEAVAKGDVKELQRILRVYAGVVEGIDVGEKLTNQIQKLNLTEEQRDILERAAPTMSGRRKTILEMNP